MSLGVRIKRLRHLRGLTQRELAAMVGVSPGYIQALESNKRSGSLELMRRLADALGADLSSLLDEAQHKQCKVYLDDLLKDEATEIWYKGQKLDFRDRMMFAKILDAILGLQTGEQK